MDNKESECVSSKVLLVGARLVNWYGFSNEFLEFRDGHNYIVGENQSGKSTALDAIKYAYMADRQFNKSSKSGERNIFGSTRWLKDPSSKEFLRPCDTWKTVTSHIVLGFYDEVYGKSFVSGVVIVTGATSENCDKYWYVLDDISINDMEFGYDDGNVWKAYTREEFAKKYDVKYAATEKDNIRMEMKLLHLGNNMEGSRMTDYRDRLRKILTYDPKSNLQQFIRDNILEVKDVDIKTLSAQKTSYDEAKYFLDQFQDEANDCEGVIEVYNKYATLGHSIAVDSAKEGYQNVYNLRKEVERLSQETQQKEVQVDRCAKDLQLIEKEYDEKKTELVNAKIQLDKLGSQDQINGKEAEITKLNDELNTLCVRIERLKALDERIRKMSSVYDEIKPAAEACLQDNLSAAEKEDVVAKFKVLISEQHDKRVNQRFKANDANESNDKEIVTVKNRIAELKQNQQSFNLAIDEKKFLDEINVALRKAGVQEKARFVCEYVSHIDEEWQDAIERYLGKKRYSIIVPEDGVKIANEVLDRSSIHGPQIVNTYLIAKSNSSLEENSLMEKLVVNNPMAKKYFEFLLGRIRAADEDEVYKYPRALAKNGKLSQSMTLSMLDDKHPLSYCMGQDAVRLNLETALQEYKRLQEQQKKLMDNVAVAYKELQDFKNMLDLLNGTFYYDAYEKKEIAESKKAKAAKVLQELKEAMQTNQEWLYLNSRVGVIAAELSSIKEKQKTQEKTINSLKEQIGSSKAGLRRSKEDLSVEEERYNELKISAPDIAAIAEKEYQEFLAGKTAKRPWSDAYKVSQKTALKNLEEDLTRAQTAFVVKWPDSGCGCGIEAMPGYNVRLNHVRIVDIETGKQTYNEYRKNYHESFKSNFIASIYQNVETAKEKISKINRALLKIEFSTTYKFDIIPLSNSSDYAKILKYGKYLSSFTGQNIMGQLSFGSNSSFDPEEIDKLEKDVERIINGVLERNDPKELAQLSDYRNYMSYNVIVNNKNIVNGKLADSIKYDSGAGVQIPYIVILTAAIIMMYNDHPGCSRLLFMDEPFEKLSDENIRIMLNFFKSQGLQSIFCAPPNKYGSIGELSSSVNSVVKMPNEYMKVQFEYHENK